MNFESQLTSYNDKLACEKSNEQSYDHKQFSIKSDRSTKDSVEDEKGSKKLYWNFLGFEMSDPRASLSLFDNLNK